MIEPLLYGSALPFLISLGLCLGFLFWRWSGFIVSLGFALSYLLCHYLLVGIPPFPPQGGSETLFYLVILTPLLQGIRGWRRGLAAFLSLCFFSLAFTFILLPMVKFQGGYGSGFLIALSALFSSVVLWGLDRVTQIPGRLQWIQKFIVSLSFLALSLSLLLNHSALLAQLAGILFALSLPPLILSLLQNFRLLPNRLTSKSGEVPGLNSSLVALGYGGLLAASAYFLDTSYMEITMLAIPLFGWGVLGLLGPKNSQGV